MNSTQHIGRDGIWGRVSRSKKLRWVVALLLAVAGAVALPAAPASANPDDIQDRSFVTWNLQGGSTGYDSKWATGVVPMVTGGRDGVQPHDFVLLQEAGPERGTHREVVQSRNGLEVIRTLWEVNAEHNPYIYWMETDSLGHRVNAAIVTSLVPDEVIIVDGAQNIPASRPVFGLRYGSTVIYSVHALSGGGGDAAGLVRNMNDAAGLGRNWVALGDFNRDPASLAAGLQHSAYSNIGYTESTGLATHVNGNELDYGVTDLGLTGFLTATRLNNLAGADHWPVEFTTLPPIRSGVDFRVHTNGDSLTEGAESSNGTGFRLLLHDTLDGQGGSGHVDMVGSQKRGAMPDPDHEGHRGWRIDEIASSADCMVPEYQPNVITLLAGVNDIDQNFNLSSAPQRLKNLINQMLEDSPKAVVVVATVLPTGKADLQPRIDAFNAELPGIVSDLRADGKHVVLVKTSDINVNEGLRGDSHPDDGGYAKLGRDFYLGIVEAADKGWLQTPDPQKPGIACDVVNDGNGTALGTGWRALGVLAPGYGRDLGDTTMAELNGDHRADYMQVAPEGGMRAAYNTVGTPGFPKWVDAGTYALFSDLPTATPVVIGRNIKFADIDGDGRDDAVYLFDSGAAAVLLNKPAANGGIEWIAPGYGVSPGYVSGNVRPDHVRYADMNGDGRDDYIRMGDDRSAHVYFNEPSGRSDGAPNWIERRGYIPGAAEATLDNVRFADVDGDRKADYLVVGPKGAVHAYLNRGTIDAAKFQQHLYWAKESGYDGANVRFYDISDDGKADYLVMYEQGSIRAWLNRGGNL